MKRSSSLPARAGARSHGPHSRMLRAGPPTSATASPKKAENQRFLDKGVPGMAAMVNKDPVDAILDLAIDENLETGFLLAGGNSDLSLLAKAIQLPNVMIGLSDAGAHVDQLCN